MGQRDSIDCDMPERSKIVIMKSAYKENRVRFLYNQTGSTLRYMTKKPYMFDLCLNTLHAIRNRILSGRVCDTNPSAHVALSDRPRHHEANLLEKRQDLD